MKKEDIEITLQTLKCLSDYRWEASSSFFGTNLAILFGYLSTEKESAAKAAAAAIHKNMNGDDVKIILTQTLMLQTGTRYQTLERAAGFVHDQMTGKDAAKILEAIDRLEDPADVTGHAASLFDNTMDGKDVAQMLEGISMLSLIEREYCKRFSLIKMHWLDRRFAIFDLKKIPLENRPPLIDAAIHIYKRHEASCICTLLHILAKIPTSKLAGCLELLDPFLERLNPIDSYDKELELLKF